MKEKPQFVGVGGLSRRQFLKTSTATALAGPFLAGVALGQKPETLRVGLIGCGGRGTGAAAQALTADPNAKLVAMGDAFKDRLQTSLEELRTQKEISGRVEVPEEKRFVGFDAYQQVLGSGVDVVLLATPPHFRPIHLKAAVEAGKHVFAEKPVAVDAPGVRLVLSTCEEARKRNLSIVSGLVMRYSFANRETIQQIHHGAIGEIRALQANDFRGPIWVKPRRPEWTDMECHLRNWYYFTWLSGDFNVEQHVHMLDTCAWIMQDEYPVSAMGLGGRQVRTGPDYGNIYDHHSVIYEYANGVKLHAYCRQQSGGVNEISAEVTGSKGIASFSERGQFITGETKWSYRGEKNNNFVTEHEELFSSIRRGKPVNNGEYMAKSTLMGILGRMATYTGQKITWEQAMNSQETLSPDRYAWDGKPPKSEVAVPGITPFV
jgi:predicted dehydrogenase